MSICIRCNFAEVQGVSLLLKWASFNRSHIYFCDSLHFVSYICDVYQIIVGSLLEKLNQSINKLTSYTVIPVCKEYFIPFARDFHDSHNELCGSWNSDINPLSFLSVNCNKFHCLVVKEIHSEKAIPTLDT